MLEIQEKNIFDLENETLLQWFIDVDWLIIGWTVPLKDTLATCHLLVQRLFLYCFLFHSFGFPSAVNLINTLYMHDMLHFTSPTTRGTPAPTDISFCLFTSCSFSHSPHSFLPSLHFPEPLGVDDGGHMTKGAAPGHVCVSTALPDTMTRTHVTWLRMLNQETHSWFI